MSKGLDDLFDLRSLAERMGWTYGSAVTLHQRAARNRRQGTVRPGDLPEPDAMFGRSPVWKGATVRRWERSRPGQGAGGGRPWS